MTTCHTAQIPLQDGSELRFTVAEPESVVRGGIVVPPEARGVTYAVRDLAASLAREGWLAVVPHLYHREGVDELPEDPGRVLGHLARLRKDEVLADTDATAHWLASRGVRADRVGVVGFDLGGAVALIVAAERDLGAAVTVDGIGVVQPLSPNLPTLVDAAPELRCPWLGIYGSERRMAVSEEEMSKLRDAAHSAEVATELIRFAEDRYCFDADQPAAVEAWMRTLNWLDSHLR